MWTYLADPKLNVGVRKATERLISNLAKTESQTTTEELKCCWTNLVVEQNYYGPLNCFSCAIIL